MEKLQELKSPSLMVREMFSYRGAVGKHHGIHFGDQGVEVLFSTICGEENTAVVSISVSIVYL
jgi:hypothetical protein